MNDEERKKLAELIARAGYNFNWDNLSIRTREFLVGVAQTQLVAAEREGYRWQAPVDGR